MRNYQIEFITRQIDTIVSALRGINYMAEKSANLCDILKIGYPMNNNIDEMILNFETWKDCILENIED